APLIFIDIPAPRASSPQIFSVGKCCTERVRLRDPGTLGSPQRHKSKAMLKRHSAESGPACTRQFQCETRGHHQETSNATKRSGLRPILEGVRYVTASDYCDVLLFSRFDRGVIRLPSASGID